jgi:hypothetical protein
LLGESLLSPGRFPPPATGATFCTSFIEFVVAGEKLLQV